MSDNEQDRQVEDIVTDIVVSGVLGVAKDVGTILVTPIKLAAKGVAIVIALKILSW